MKIPTQRQQNTYDLTGRQNSVFGIIKTTLLAITNIYKKSVRNPSSCI